MERNILIRKKLFNEQGYQLPDLVFWNVDSRNRQQPVRVNDQGVALVSGCNSRIFSMLKSDILSPYAVMMDVLGSERYAAIVAYKSMDEIVSQIEPTAEIVQRIRPVYNFKAAD